MNQVKRAARRRFLRQVSPTGPNKAGKRTKGELALVEEQPPLYNHIENGRVPGSMRGNDWLKENRQRRATGQPQLRG